MAFWLLIACAVAMTAAQAVYPGASVYHTGWYNAVDIALLVVAAAGYRRRNAVVALFGAAVIVFTGAASGLMGADTHLVVGAPGAAVRDADAGGSFDFPLANSGDPVILQRGTHAISIGTGPRYSGGFAMWRTPRTVVYIEAADADGNHLTITQPTNASFLSPVLLMQQTTAIAGMNVRYDTFSVPALRRNVKAVLFTEQQAAQLRSNPPITGKPAVLFAVSDNADHIVSNGIGLVPSGERKNIGGLILGATAGTYPAITVASIPYFPVFIAGLLVFVVGLALNRFKK